MKDPREGESWEKPWCPLPSDLPPRVKAYITRLVKQFEAGQPVMLDCHDMATLIAIKAFEAGGRRRTAQKSKDERAPGAAGRN